MPHIPWPKGEPYSLQAHGRTVARRLGWWLGEIRRALTVGRANWPELIVLPPHGAALEGEADQGTVTVWAWGRH